MWYYMMRFMLKMMLYIGGQMFGRSANDPNGLAKTVLGIIVSCMFGAPNFLSKFLPTSRLNALFLQDQVQL